MRLPRKKRNKKYYIVLSRLQKRMHGAFPFSPEGLEKAGDLIKELERKTKDRFVIKEK